MKDQENARTDKDHEEDAEANKDHKEDGEDARTNESQGEDKVIREVDDVMPPKPVEYDYVSDMARVISSNQRTRINEVLKELRRDKHLEMSVVTLANYRNLTPQEAASGQLLQFSRKLFDKWGIGNKVDNSGSLLLMSLKQRRTEIVIGKGVVSSFPDKWMEWMQMTHVTPSCKKGEHGEALLEAVKQMDRQARGIYTPPVGEERNFQNYLKALVKGERPLSATLAWLWIAGIMAICIWAMFTSGRSSHGGGGGGGYYGGGYSSGGGYRSSGGGGGFGAGVGTGVAASTAYSDYSSYSSSSSPSSYSSSGSYSGGSSSGSSSSGSSW